MFLSWKVSGSQRRLQRLHVSQQPQIPLAFLSWSDFDSSCRVASSGHCGGDSYLVSTVPPGISFFSQLLYLGEEKGKSPKIQKKTLSEPVCVRTYQRVKFTDLLSFPLHSQQQPLLLPLQLFSFLTRHTVLHLSHQLILLPATHESLHY